MRRGGGRIDNFLGLGPRRLLDRLQSKDKQTRRSTSERRDSSGGAVGDFDIGDAMGQHDREENQDENAADVDQHLHRGDKIGAEKNVDARPRP